MTTRTKLASLSDADVATLRAFVAQVERAQAMEDALATIPKTASEWAVARRVYDPLAARLAAMRGEYGRARAALDWLEDDCRAPSFLFDASASTHDLNVLRAYVAEGPALVAGLEQVTRAVRDAWERRVAREGIIHAEDGRVFVAPDVDPSLMEAAGMQVIRTSVPTTAATEESAPLPIVPLGLIALMLGA